MKYAVDATKIIHVCRFIILLKKSSSTRGRTVVLMPHQEETSSFGSLVFEVYERMKRDGGFRF